MTDSAERQRRRRRRQRDGKMCVLVEIDSVSVPQALVDAGLLAATDVDDPRAIAAALSKAIIHIERHA